MSSKLLPSSPISQSASPQQPQPPPLSTQTQHSQIFTSTYDITNDICTKIKNTRTMLKTKCTNISSRKRIITQPIEQKKNSTNSMKSFMDTTAIDRMLVKKDNHGRKRIRFMSELRKNTYAHSSLTKYNDTNQQTLNQQHTKAKKVKDLDKKYNKGPLKKKIVQTWLNTILTECTQTQSFDLGFGNAALKQHQIDENALLARGVKPQNVERIYQTLFVHSIGFNNNIKQLVNHNNELMKNIWKVFSLLLEYCAEGKFETLIGIIERDKTIKIEEMKDQITKKQQIIDRNDQLNQTKNIELFKQIKHVKQQYTNLINQKQLLNENYRRTEQAFSQQFSLRIKFENKINELFGVHRELSTKHKMLYEDYKKKFIQCNQIKNKNQQLTYQNNEFKVKVTELQHQKQRLLHVEKYKNQLLNALKQEKAKLNEQHNFLRHQYDSQRRMTKQNIRRVTQLEMQLRGLRQIANLKDSSWHEINQQQKRSIQQNRNLNTLIDEQRKQINQLVFEQKEHSTRILTFKTAVAYEQKKKQELMESHQHALREIKETKEKNGELELENRILGNKISSLEDDIKVNYLNIEKMHQNNAELENGISELTKYKQNVDKLIQQKNQEIVGCHTKISQLQKEIAQLKTLIYKNQTAFKLKRTELQTIAQNYRIKYQKIRQERQLLLMGDNQKNHQLLALRVQQQKSKRKLTSTILQLKNQKFQRVHLKTNYQQSLNLIQKKNRQQKQFGRKISQLKDLIITITQQRNYLQQTLQFEIIKKQKLERTLTQLRNSYVEYKKNKYGYLHPMVFEDLAQRTRCMKQKLLETETQLWIKNNQIKQLEEKSENQVAALIAQHSQFIQKQRKQKQKQLQLKQNLIEYQKSINENLKSKIQSLQNLAMSYSKQIQLAQRQNKQKLYLDLLQQKTKTIDQLLFKLNQSNTHNETLKKQLIQIKSQHQQILIKLKQNYQLEVDDKNSKINQLTFEKKYYEKQMNKCKEDIANFETQFQEKVKQSMQYYIQNNKNTNKNQQKTQQKMLTEFSNPNNKKKKSFLQQPKIKQSKQEKQPKQQKQSIIEKIQKDNPEIKKRNSISRKIQNSFNYYQCN